MQAQPNRPSSNGGPDQPSEPSGSREPSLDAALAAVENLDDAPVVEHVAAFETVHRLLQNQLAEAER